MSHRKETEEERAIRKEKERKEKESRNKSETEEERTARKERERREYEERRKNETEEERAARKEKERKEKESRHKNETEDERAQRKAREKAEHEERKKKREEEERMKAEEKARREVVHKPLPPARGTQPAPKSPQAKPIEKPVQAAPPKQVTQQTTKITPKKKTDEEDEGDDYEGYEDDFETSVFNPEDLKAATSATNRENVDVKAKTTASSHAAGGSSATSTAPELQGTSRAGLDVDSLKRGANKAQFEKDLSRATALRRLVDLDTVSATLADIAPMSEYDMFIRNFGVGRQQIAIQAPPLEDQIDVEIQAERVHCKHKTCQAPTDLGLFPERYAIVPGQKINQSNMGQLGDEEDGKAQRGAATTEGSSPNAATGSEGPQQHAGSRVDTAALSTFLSNVFPVITCLLDENETSRNPIARRASMSTHTFSSHVQALTNDKIGSRRVVDICFSQLATQYLLAVYGPPSAADEKETSNEMNNYLGLTILWNINDPQHPDKLFVSHDELTVGCLSSTRSHLIYCGTAQGTICIWDTREPDHHHVTSGGGGPGKRSGVPLRIPSYTTDWSASDNHETAVMRLMCSGYNSILGSKKDESDQLISLDKRGHLALWVVNEGDTKGKNADASLQISDMDFGQNIFSTVSIFRASTLSVPSNLSDALRQKTDTYGGKTGGTAAETALRSSYDLECSPLDAAHLFVATSHNIVQLSRFGSIVAPSMFEARSQWGTCPACISIHFSPTDSRLLVTGFADGTVRLYLKDCAKPKLIVQVSQDPIVRVRCHTTLKWVTYVLDSAGRFFVLDFAGKVKSMPIAASELKEAKAGMCYSFNVSIEEKGTSRVCFGYEQGLVEVHTLTEKLIALSQGRQENWL